MPGTIPEVACFDPTADIRWPAHIREILERIRVREFAPDAVALLRCFVAERDDEVTRGDPGCLICTDGTTPSHRETGLCTHHAAEALLRKIDGETL